MRLFNILHKAGKFFFSLVLLSLTFLRKILPGNSSDVELIEAYRRTNDLSILGELYNRYMDLVYGVCLKYLKMPEDAQDSVMNIFEELVTKLQKHQVENFKSWLYSLAKNHCLMRLRSEKRTPVVTIKEDFVQSEESGHLEEVLTKEESFLQVEDCLKQLSAEQRRAVELFYLQSKCYNEIAAETGLEWKAVRSYIQNGRRNLKLCMESNAKNTVVK